MPGDTSPKKVLLVEDDASLREGLVELVSEQAAVREAGSVAQALEALEAERFTLVMTDLRIGQTGEGGRLILEAARKRLQPVVIVSAASADDVARVLRPHEPDEVLRKPFQLDDIISLVERFVGLCRDTERVAGQGPPPGAAWNEVAPGVSTWESPEGPRWWKLAPGARQVRPAARGRMGMVVCQGSLEVEGERREGAQYLYLAAGPREVGSAEGCLAVSLPLRVP